MRDKELKKTLEKDLKETKKDLRRTIKLSKEAQLHDFEWHQVALGEKEFYLRLKEIEIKHYLSFWEIF